MLMGRRSTTQTDQSRHLHAPADASTEEESPTIDKAALLAIFVRRCIETANNRTIGMAGELSLLQDGGRYVGPLNDNENDGADDDEALRQLAVEETRISRRLQEIRRQHTMLTEGLTERPQPLLPKFHWDYLLAEMIWLADDFNREKAWKRVCAKKLANAVVKSIREKRNKISKEAKQETFKVRRNCANVAKIVKDWWRQMEKIVLAKQQFRLNAKRQEAVTTHLGKVIETTEKYTEWLTEDLKPSANTDLMELVTDPDYAVELHDLDVDDDEETIDIDEQELEKSARKDDAEIEDLLRDAAMDLDSLIATLPSEYVSTGVSLQNSECVHMDPALDCVGSEVVIVAPSDKDNHISSSDDDSVEFEKKDSGNSTSDEETILEQESFEQTQGPLLDGSEVSQLEKEANLSLDELLVLYGSDAMDLEQIDDVGSFSTSSAPSQSAPLQFSEDSTASSDVSDDSVSLDSSGNSDLLHDSCDSVDLREVFDCDGGANENGSGDGDINSNFILQDDFDNITKVAMSTLPKGHTIESAHVKVNVPHLLRGTLREYQLVGLDWLVAIYDKKLNGILADEMGLGKTIQTIALLAHLACEKGIWGPHLIVVPTSVILNWEVEFKRWCPGFKMLSYYGSAKDRRDKRKGWTKTNAFHVCITSYKLAIQDSLVFKRKKWKYLILDEAQNIKNFKSQRWQTLLTFNSQRRLLLTGTPLQNSLMELWSLMHFLMPNIFQSHKEFQEWFGSPLTGMIEGNAEYNEQLVRRLHKVLRPFILRRLKKDVEKQMPKKYEHIIMCKLSKRQRCLYDDFMSLTSTQETLASGQFLNVINILMQLRKVCNHPNLFETRPTISPFLMIDELELNVPRLVFIKDFYSGVNKGRLFPYMTSSLVEMALDLPKFVSERILGLKPRKILLEEVDDIRVEDWVSRHRSHNGQKIQKSHRQFLFRSMFTMNPSEDGTKSMDDEISLTDCIHTLSDRENTGIQIVREMQLNKNDSLLPDNILWSRVQHRRDVLKSIAFRNDIRCSLASLCLDVEERSFNCYKTVKLPGLTGRTLEEIYVNAADLIKLFVFCVPSTLASTVRFSMSCGLETHTRNHHDTVIYAVRQLTPLGFFQVLNQQRVQFPDTRLIQYDCGKLQTLEVLLKRLYKEGHRCLIFTQMTRMLDILEQFLSYLGYRYVRLDGTTKVEQRQMLMETFNQDSRIFVFILSTRSGGLGINLTGADTVIFYDSDWNPTMDAQAQDRCHRIGQTRDVHIYRLISQMTIEENILKKANQKRTLNDMAIEGGQFSTAFFKTNTLKDLFKAPSGLDDFIQEQMTDENEQQDFMSDECDQKFQKTLSQVLIITRSGRQVNWKGPMPAIQSTAKLASVKLPNTATADNPHDSIMDTTEFEAALEEIEDENDRIATRRATAEVKADLAEFDESIPWEDGDAGAAEQVTIGTAPSTEENDGEENFHLETERQIREFEGQLNPIQRFGVRMIEAVIEGTLADQLEVAQQNLESSKKTWQLEQLKALHEADEMKAEIEEDDMLYCYGKYDVSSQRKELERLRKEEADFHRAERQRDEEKAKQAKDEAARKAWCRQQHFLALKRKHMQQATNRCMKYSRGIKQARMTSGPNAKLSSNPDGINCTDKRDNIGEHSNSHNLTKLNHSAFSMNKYPIPPHPFHSKVRINHSNIPALCLPRPHFQTRFSNITYPRPTHPMNIQSIRGHSILPSKPTKQISSISLPRAQDKYVHSSTAANLNMPQTNHIKIPIPVSTTPNASVNISSNVLQLKTSNVVTNGFSNPSPSPIQIPVQIRSSITPQHLIINSQPVLLFNRSIQASNSSFIAPPATSFVPSSVIQIVNRTPTVTVSSQLQPSPSSSVVERTIVNQPPRFSNVISHPFLMSPVAGGSPNIIRINCSSSGVCVPKSSDYLKPSIIPITNVSNPVIRLAPNTSTQPSPSSNPVIIFNNIGQNKSSTASIIPHAVTYSRQVAGTTVMNSVRPTGGAPNNR